MKTLVLAVLGGLLLLFAAPVATAVQAPAQAGTLRALGQGNVRFDARGFMEFRMAGEGVLVVRDADDVDWRAVGVGQITFDEDGALRIANFHGVVRLRANDLRGRFIGGSDGNVRVRAVGSGLAFLRGAGVYASGASQGQWTPTGTPVQW